MEYSTTSSTTAGTSVSFVTPTYPVESKSKRIVHLLRLLVVYACLCNKSKEKEKITVDDDYVTLIQLEGSTILQSWRLVLTTFQSCPLQLIGPSITMRWRRCIVWN